MRSVFFLAVLAMLAPAGCARKQTPVAAHQAYSGPAAAAPATNAPAVEPPLIVTPLEGLNGKVSSVNANLRFVVLTFPVGQMAGIDQHLNVYRRGLKVGELDVTGPQRDDSIVADISAGEAEAGDEVRDK
jgi:hypothetical protein